MRYQLDPDDNILTVVLPVKFRRKRGRKMIMASDTDAPLLSEQDLAPSKPDETFVSALVKAFRWQEMIDQSMYDNPKELAKKQGIEVTHVYRIMRLTMLAPDIVDAVLHGKQPRDFMLQAVVRGFPISWKEQRAKYGFPAPEQLNN
jgi:hypothetical protein